jgi:hypothetical protein
MQHVQIPYADQSKKGTTKWHAHRTSSLETIGNKSNGKVDGNVGTLIGNQNFFYDKTPYSPLEVNLCLGGTYSLHYQGPRVSSVIKA